MNNQLKGGRRIDDWRPEDEKILAKWRQPCRYSKSFYLNSCTIACIFGLVIWSVIVVRMPEVGFQFDKAQLSWLWHYLPYLGQPCVYFMRFSTCFGGRRWTTLSTASLLIPTIWLVGYTKP